MSQDIISDTLNQIMNAKRAGKNSIVMGKHSKLLLSVLALAKLKGYIKTYKVTGTTLAIDFEKLNGCNSIKPRFFVKSDGYEKYIKRFLPEKDFVVLIISTSQGLMTHQTAEEKNIGGCLLAYFY